MKKPILLKLVDTPAGPAWTIHKHHVCTSEAGMINYAQHHNVDVNKPLYKVVDLEAPLIPQIDHPLFGVITPEEQTTFNDGLIQKEERLASIDGRNPMAVYHPAKGKLLATIRQHGKIVCIFKLAPTEEQGHAMAEALNHE